MLNDLLADNLKIVFCGSAAGTKSAAVKQYYAGPGNRFWRTLHETGLTPRQLSPSEYSQLLDFGVGLTDLIKGQSGMDAAINFAGHGAEDLRRRVLKHQPRSLAFNGKRSALEFFGVKSIGYGEQAERIGASTVFVLPSTSGAARASWDLGHWRTLASFAQAGNP